MNKTTGFISCVTSTGIIITKHKRRWTREKSNSRVFFKGDIQTHQSLWWDRSLAGRTLCGLQLLPSSSMQEVFLFLLCDTVTLLPSTNFKPGTIKKGGETVLWLTQQRAYSFGWALLHNSDQQRRKTHNTQGVWLTVHPITLWVANIKARCLHVAWQDVPPLVLKTKSWFSPSRAGFALYRARGQEKEITQPKHISDSVLKSIDTTFLFSGAGNGQRK